MRRRHSQLADEPQLVRKTRDVDATAIADETVVVPRRADPPPKPSFPIMGALAPLGVAAVVWFVLHSPLALVFALLSPVMAVATLLDGRASGRRAARRNDAELVERTRAFLDRVDAFHSREKATLRQRAPSARTILGRTVNPFTATAPAQVEICLGTGSVKSGIRVEGGTDDDESRRLRTDALVLTDAPIVAPSPARIAVVGARPLAHAIARSYGVQIASAVSPDAVAFLATPAPRDEQAGEWAWVRSLPHCGDDEVRLGPLDAAARAAGETFIVVVESVDAVPAEATVVVAADSVAEVTVLRHPRLPTPFRVEGEFVSAVEADEFSDRLNRQLSAVDRAVFELPARVTSDVVAALAGSREGGASSSSSAGLAAAIGIGEHGGVFSLDLVAQGPHAVVAGTTGSGKSELLVTWVAALAREYDVASLTVLLVDFKGGAAFDPLVGLEQCVGLITDLDPGGAERALSSLRAEVRWREKILRESSARDISDERLGGQLPRLVIVVDEFAAMLSEFPQLHDVFADIAARGRSLGMHLVLCTQRPSGVVRDSLLANCELRLSLRVNNAADSTAIIGSPAAAALSPEHRGRCLVSTGGRAPVMVQVAHTDAAGLSSRRDTKSRNIRAPWLPALPQRILLADLPKPSSGFAIGLLDLPDEQCQPLACYVPDEHGSLLILGSSRSGKSVLLETISHQAPDVITVGSTTEQAWDAVRDTLALCRRRQAGAAAQTPVVVLIDDLDSVLRRFDPEYQGAIVSDLATILRDGPPCGIRIVASAQRSAAPLAALVPLFAERIHLRFASRQEYIVSEGAAADHDPRLPPGAGHWRGSRLQVALVPDAESTRSSEPSRHARAVLRPSPFQLLVVTSQPKQFLRRGGDAVPSGIRVIDAGDRAALSAFSSGAETPVWLVGTPDAWMASWATFAALRSDIPVFFDGCSLGDFRSLTRRRDLPPPVDQGRRARWLLAPDDTISRIEWSEDSGGYVHDSQRIS